MLVRKKCVQKCLFLSIVKKRPPLVNDNEQGPPGGPREKLISFLSYFEKIAHMSVVPAYVSLWLCVFVSLYVRMFVTRANKVEGTMS